jgi:phenylalanyl-tRNA synthetase alpha chain
VGPEPRFVPFSRFPACYKDVSFWTPSGFHENDLAECVRDVVGDIAERVRLLDSFVHPATGRESRCYRIEYRAMDR